MSGELRLTCSSVSWCPLLIFPHDCVSAPGYAWNKLSTVRFSCTIMTTCLIGMAERATILGKKASCELGNDARDEPDEQPISKTSDAANAVLMPLHGSMRRQRLDDSWTRDPAYFGKDAAHNGDRDRDLPSSRHLWNSACGGRAKPRPDGGGRQARRSWRSSRSHARSPRRHRAVRPRNRARSLVCVRVLVAVPIGMGVRR